METSNDKYIYLIARSWTVRAVYLFGIIAWLMTAYGFMRFATLSSWYFVAITPFVLLFSAQYLLSYGINLFYKPFNKRAHESFIQQFWKSTKGKEPEVDVLITTCGESFEVIYRTVAAAVAIDYARKRVYLLDDKGDVRLAELAKEAGVTYLSRPNKGENKKAGNLQYGLQYAKSDFFAVFDADFAPHPDFIHDLLPYMQDAQTAVVQSPQYFETSNAAHARSKVAFGAAHVQEDFYRVIQPARDVLGGAVCVGSSAMYRRSSIDDIGGIPQVEHSEDIECGYALASKGLRVKYIPLVLSLGLCPTDLNTYFHQQHRWCTGSLRLMVSRRFWTAQTTMAQKLCYISGFLYYASHALVPIFAFQVFVVYFLHFSEITAEGAMVYYPLIFFSFVLLPYMFRLAKPRLGSHVVRQVHYYYFGHALMSHASRNVLDWQPSGALRDQDSAFGAVVWYKALYIAVYFGLTVLAIAWRGFPLFDIRYAPILIWIVYTNVSHFILFFFLLRDIRALSAVPSWKPVSLQLSMATAMAAIIIAAGAPLLSRDGGIAPLADSSGHVVPIVDEVKAAVPADESGDVIKIVAEKGDSQTLLARRAVLTYSEQANIDLKPWQIVYLETSLSESRKYIRVDVGGSHAYSIEVIEKFLADAEGLYSGQLDKWKTYALTTNLSIDR